MKSLICRDENSWAQAHNTVLQNSSLVALYIDEHKDNLRYKHPEVSEDWITREHIRTFGGWLQSHLRGNTTVGDDLYLLARTPSLTVLTFQGYEINGNTFYTIVQDKKSSNQNSGVRIDATNNNWQKDTYYGYIEDIWELDYGRDFKVPLFQCKWVNCHG